MYLKFVFQKIVLFAIGFSVVFYVVRSSGIIPQEIVSEDARAIVPLFSGISLIFSIISGFVVQAQWRKWYTTLDASRGEVNMLRHMYTMADHFPARTRKNIRDAIKRYLVVFLKVNNQSKHHSGLRSREVDIALNDIEKNVFYVLEKHSQTGMAMFMLFSRAMEYREQRIQNSRQRLPSMLKLLIILLIIILVTSSFFIFFNNIWFEYVFRLVLALLAYTIYLIIEDMDNPYQPGNFKLSFIHYRELLDEMYEDWGRKIK